MNRTKILVLFPLLFLAVGLNAQVLPPASKVEKEYRQDYRRASRAAERTVGRLVEEKWDIVLPVEEQVPTARFEAGVAAINHWGKNLLLPASLVQRLTTECTHPVLVKISDTGVDEAHPELAGAWWLPESDYTGDTRPIHLHGTHVAGITFSFLEPLAKAGVVKFKDVRNLNADGAGSFSTAAAMLITERAEDQSFRDAGTAVIYNMSWGGMRGIEPTMEKEMQKSAAAGVLFVVAAGNNGPGVASSYPAMSAYAVATASLDESLNVSSYSTRGDFVDQAMPGRNIISTVPGGGFATLSGTSMASPMETAAAAIAKAKWGDLIPDANALHAYLKKVTSDISPEGWDNASGWGINYIVAILDTKPGDTPTPPPPPPPAPTNTITGNWSDYTIKWAYSGSSTYHSLYFTHLRLEVTAEGTGPELWDRIAAWLPVYFSRRAVIIPDSMSVEDAVYWTGRFLEAIAKDEGLGVKVLEIVGNDEYGRNYFSEGLSSQGESYAPGVKLVPIE